MDGEAPLTSLLNILKYENVFILLSVITKIYSEIEHEIRIYY